MECPMCGSSYVAVRPLLGVTATGCQCGSCSFRWIQHGTPPVPDFWKETRALLVIRLIYVGHAVVVWMPAGAVHFLIAVEHPVLTVQSLRPSEWSTLLALMGLSGAAFGWLVAVSLYQSVKWFGKTPVAHVILPLLTAAGFGVAYALLLASASNSSATAAPVLPLALRQTGLNVAVSVGLALFCTPVVIVRSAAFQARLGLRPPLAAPRDPRWD